MGAPFAQWLGRPETICFLRRLLATTGDAIPTRGRTITTHHGRRRRVHTATVAEHSANEISEELEEHAKIRARKVESQSQHDALRTVMDMSFRSGVHLVDEETPAEEAYKALWHQVNVGSRRSLGDLIVDRPEHRHNMKLWIELLEHRQRIDGFSGVAEVWKGMRYRKVDLPVSGREAEVLWTTLFHACISTSHSDSHAELLGGILDHAKDLHRQSGASWPGLYKCFIGRMLRITPQMAPMWHKKLVRDWQMPIGRLSDLADDCAASLNKHKARTAFRNIHRASGQRDVYDRFMPEILKHVEHEEGLRWHQVFLRVGDGPSADVFALPVIQRLFDLDRDKSLPMIHKRSDDRSSTNGHSGAQYPRLTRSSMSAMVGEVHGIKPKEVSDTFVAKMFATRAFTLEIVIKGLGFFGVEHLGPLALHEMALKAATPVEFCNRLRELKTMGISVDRSVYGRLIQKVAIDGPAHLFQVLLASDQHPESYEDSRTQEGLLASFLEKKDMQSAHIALLAMSLAGDVEHSRAWSQVLQHYIMQRDHLSINKTMRHMQDSKMPPTMRTLNIISHHLLPPRTIGKAPTKMPREAAFVKPLQFANNAYMFAAENGIHVKPGLWKELLKRYAMQYRWDECERLVWWLASWYGKDVGSKTAEGRRRHWYGTKTLADIFSAEMQKALIHWSIRCAGHSRLLYKGASYSDKCGTINGEECEPWARGLLLLKSIRQFGLQVFLRDVRRALVVRLLSLFGPAFSTKRVNEEVRLYNRLTLADYIEHANEIWNANLFNVSHTLLSDVPPNPSKLMVAIFGVRRRVGQKSKEYANIAEYVRALEEGYPLNVTGRRSHKRRNWLYSPFRLVRRVPIQRRSSPSS